MNTLRKADITAFLGLPGAPAAATSAAACRARSGCGGDGSDSLRGWASLIGGMLSRLAFSPRCSRRGSKRSRSGTLAGAPARDWRAVLALGSAASSFRLRARVWAGDCVPLSPPLVSQRFASDPAALASALQMVFSSDSRRSSRSGILAGGPPKGWRVALTLLRSRI
jgi:hypothetical protein